MKLFSGLTIALFILIASTLDHEDEQLMLADYCDKVEEGIQPNYKDINCEE